MKYSITILLSMSIILLTKGQDITDEMKGTWIINRFQSAGAYGMSYQLAELFIGDTITINEVIRESFEENEYTRAAGISPIICEFHPIKKQRIENANEYFSDKFEIKPLVLGIKDPSQLFLINTDCKDVFYKEIYYDIITDQLFLFSEGMFFILGRLENK